MAPRKKFFTINKLANKWEDYSSIDIKNLIIIGKLKASVINDGNCEQFDAFTDIPINLRQNLIVIKQNQGLPNKYNKSSRAWNKINISAEEVSRYELENKEDDTAIIHKTNTKGDNPKSISSLLKMVAVMAATGYQYKRAENKSKVPGEIVNDAANMSISIDEKTVREWLKKAFADINQNKPEDV